MIDYKELVDVDIFKDYLVKMSLFSNYSIENIYLILKQMPSATILAGFNTWKKDYNKSINKGSKSIKIKIPALINQDDSEYKKLDYKLVNTFDISQTNGPKYIDNRPNINSEDLIKILRQNIKYGIYFGYNSSVINDSIVIKPNWSLNKQIFMIFKTYTKLKYVDQLKANELEFISDCVAFSLCNYYDIDIDINFDDLEKYDLDRILRTIKNIVHEIINYIDDLITKSKSILKLTFNETQLINILMWEDDKYRLLKRLINYDNSIDDKELKESLLSLSRKIKKLSEENVSRLYFDRINYKTKTFPQYLLK